MEKLMGNPTDYNDFTDESMELIHQWYTHYGEKFLENNPGLLSEEQRNELPFILSSFCDFCYSYHLQKPGQWTSDAVKDVCINIMPRKVMADEKFFCAIVPALYNFFDWMSLEGHLPNTETLKKTLLAVEPKVLSNSQNANNWGIGKSLMMGASAKGYDTQNFNAIRAALAHENADDLLTSATDMTRDLRKLPKQDNEISTLEDIINDLRYLTRGFPKAAVKKAIEKQKEITPLLLNMLNETDECYQSLENHDMGHLYSMSLLAQFREQSAFPLIIKLASLPEDATDMIFGDGITEDLHKMIASVYNNDLTAIQQLIENPTLCIWSRNAGLKSLLALVKAGALERNQIIHYFKELFNHPAFVDDEMAMTQLVNASCDLYPAELYDEIKAAFDRNVVDTTIVNMKWIDKTLAMGQDKALKQYLNEHYDLISDTLQEMQWWACFQDQQTENFGNKFEFHKLEKMLSNYVYDKSHPKKTKVGRNDPCPCGSNKKFKKCCLTTH